MSRRSWYLRGASVTILAALTGWMTFDARGYERLLRVLVPDQEVVLYPTRTMPVLMGQQLLLAGAASVLALVAGAVLGLLALSRVGRPFRDLIVSIGRLAQMVPSVAIMALVIPMTGYGAEPVIVALVLYSILPIVLNIVSGIESVPPAVADAATGVGMTRPQRLTRVEIPLALPVIMGGIKNMVVINVSAATLGAVVAAGGLGMPILAGFAEYNEAFIVQGALPSITLALLLDRLLSPLPLTSPASR
jgi:osmoprotectant transport system permease protein